MIKTNVIDLLKTFSGEELALFEQFISTSFHNKNIKVISLFSELKKYHPEYEDAELTKEKLYRNLAGKGKYKDTYIRNLFSDLNNLAELFLQYRLIRDNITFKKLLIEELKNRDLLELAEKKINSFEKELKKIRTKDQEYYQSKSFIFDMKSFLQVDKTLTDNFRKEHLTDIIKLFSIILMENSFYMQVEEQRVKIKHSFDFLNVILDYIKHNLADFEDSPLLMIYYYLCLHYFYQEEDKYFLKAKEYFRNHFSLLSMTDKKNIYSVMQIHYLNKIDRGYTDYNKEYLNFLLEMLKLKVLSHKQKDFINLNLYRNVLILCTMLNETEILKKFISKYLSFVEAKSLDTVSAYSYSHLNFLQGNFNKALEYCNKINFSDLLISTNDNLFFKNDIKALTLKSLYELNYIESAISYIDTYKHFLRKSKLIKDHPRKKYLNFLKYVSGLIRLKLKFDDFAFAELKKQFLASDELTQSAWISEKIYELERKYKS